MPFAPDLAARLALFIPDLMLEAILLIELLPDLPTPLNALPTDLLNLLVDLPALSNAFLNEPPIDLPAFLPSLPAFFKCLEDALVDLLAPSVSFFALLAPLDQPVIFFSQFGTFGNLILGIFHPLNGLLFINLGSLKSLNGFLILNLGILIFGIFQFLNGLLIFGSFNPFVKLGTLKPLNGLLNFGILNPLNGFFRLIFGILKFLNELLILGILRPLVIFGTLKPLNGLLGFNPLKAPLSWSLISQNLMLAFPNKSDAPSLVFPHKRLAPSLISPHLSPTPCFTPFHLPPIQEPALPPAHDPKAPPAMVPTGPNKEPSAAPKVPPTPPPIPEPTPLYLAVVPALLFFKALKTSKPANKAFKPPAPRLPIVPSNLPEPPRNLPIPVLPNLVNKPAPPSDSFPNPEAPPMSSFPRPPLIPPLPASDAPFRNVLSMIEPNFEFASFCPNVNLPLPDTADPVT